jgi:hypothetical protein
MAGTRGMIEEAMESASVKTSLSCKTYYPLSSSDEASVVSEASEPPVKSNRTNSSLTHQRGSRK